MKPGIPWSVKGIEPEVREAAKHAARKAGMTLGEWLNTVILDQSDDQPAGDEAEQMTKTEDFFDSDIALAPPPPPRREDSMVRLEDIAQQLAQLAQRERESAVIAPYEPPRARNSDSETLNRILSRIDNNERQAVEAFTAVNERLSVLGRQIAMSAKPAKGFDKPEDVPGFTSLESAIRNVVEHIELSEKRTRDSLKSMQDRMAEMSQRASHSNTEDLLRTAPAFTSLEQRIADLATRLQRSESQHQALPDLVRKELGQLTDRIETVRKATEQVSARAQTEAVAAAQHELRDIEGRILGLLRDAQSALGGQTAAAADLQKLRGDIGLLNKRIDEMGASTARDRDVHALRVAVEQLSTRVAQGPDMRPLADMDRRLGELNQRLEQNHAASRNLPQFGELERRIAELDHRLAEAMRLQGDGQALTALEQHIGDVNQRLARTEEQLGHLETMEQAIHQLYQGLEDNRAFASKVAEDAAMRAAERVFAAQQAQSAEPSQELQALRDGLHAVRESAVHADQRNQETLEAVHETLEQIVNKLAELETAAAGHQVAATMAQQAAAQPQPPSAAPQAAWSEPATQQVFFDPAGSFAPQQVQPEFQVQPTPVFEAPPAAQPYAPPQQAYAPEPQMPGYPPAAIPHPQAEAFAAPQPHAQPHMAPAPDFSAGGLEAGDDFIAAARRAAQAAATRSGANVLAPENKPQLKAGANNRFKFSIPFLGAKTPKPVTYVGGRPVAEPDSQPMSSMRRKLILAGIVLLAAVSAVGFNFMARSGKPAKQQTMIEQQVAPVAQAPVATVPAMASEDFAETAGAMDEVISDGIITGSLPARKTDSSLSALVSEPGSGALTAEEPPADVGTQALRQAAARGDAKAQFIIASRYLDGQGVEQNLPQAAHWYQLAASRGLPPAQYRLATLFERGKGVPQDVSAALLWYERAAEGGNVKAMHNAAVIAAGNQVGAPNYDKAFRWFSRAAEAGLKDSQFNLAVLFERGLGTKVDKSEALLWYTLAGQQGDADAAKRADGLASTMTGAEVAAVTARLSAWKAVPSSDDANVVAITDAAWNDIAAAPAPAEDIATPEPSNPVMQAQALLQDLGYNVGEPDGEMGTRTQNAIRLFQLQQGMKVTGEVTPDLLYVLRNKKG